MIIQIICFSLIQVGDSLLTLPQQLEPFFVQDQNINLLAALKVGKIPYQENQGRGFIVFFVYFFNQYKHFLQNLITKNSKSPKPIPLVNFTDLF